MKKVWEFIKKHKKLIIILAIVAVVVAGIIYIASVVKKAQGLFAGMGNSATTEVIERRDIVNSITATGTIVAVDKRTVSSTVTGVKVKQLNVAVGDQVNAGDIICLLDGENLEQQLADAQIMMNADAGRSGLDVASSNRGLKEAIESRDIAAVRAEEDKNTAYHHAQDAGNEALEAENKYKDAASNTKTFKDKMDAAANALEKAKKAPAADNSELVGAAEAAVTAATDAVTAAEGNVTTAENEYAATATTMHADVVSICGLDISNEYYDGYFMQKQGIASSITISDIYSGDAEAVRAKIESRIEELKIKDQAITNAKQSLETAQADKKAAENKLIEAQSSASMMKNETIEAARAAYEKAKAEYDSAVLQEESQKSAYEAKLKSVESMWESYNNVLRGADDSKRSNDSAVAARVDSVKNSQIGASTATLSDKRNIANLQEQIDSCVVTSSIGGIVTDVAVIEGDNYMGGAIVTIENTSDYEVSALIDEYDIAKVKVDQEVIIKTNGTGTVEMQGKVKTIAPHASTAPGVSGVKYEVIISVLDKNEDLRLDMTAKVEIICEKAADVLSVATEAIQEDDDGNYYVEVLDSGSTIDTSALMTNPEEISEEDVEKLQSGEKTYESHNVTVTKGLAGDYYTEISGDGLEEGTKVVIPNEGAMADINEYMEQAGAAGGY